MLTMHTGDRVRGGVGIVFDTPLTDPGLDLFERDAEMISNFVFVHLIGTDEFFDIVK